MSSAHEVVHLVVLVNDVALEIPQVERLALEREHGPLKSYFVMPTVY